MEMHQIRYFLAVAEELNFTRAADRCNVTQPALTRAIQKLEEELGGLLFRRERSLTHLTDLGRLMRPHLEQVLKETEAAKSTATSFLRLSEAPLNLGIMCTIGPLRFVGFLNRFRTENPGIELSMIEATPAISIIARATIMPSATSTLGNPALPKRSRIFRRVSSMPF